MTWADVMPGCRSLLNRAVEQTVPLVVRGLPRTCWKCSASVVTPVVLHPRGQVDEFSVLDVVEGDPLVMLREYLVAAGHPAAGTIKPRFSKTVGGRYLSHGCPGCDALFGAFPLNEELVGVQAKGRVDGLPVVVQVERPLLEWWALSCDRDKLWDYEQ